MNRIARLLSNNSGKLIGVICTIIFSVARRTPVTNLKALFVVMAVMAFLYMAALLSKDELEEDTIAYRIAYRVAKIDVAIGMAIPFLYILIHSGILREY